MACQIQRRRIVEANLFSGLDVPQRHQTNLPLKSRVWIATVIERIGRLNFVRELGTQYELIVNLKCQILSAIWENWLILQPHDVPTKNGEQDAFCDTRCCDNALASYGRNYPYCECRVEP